MRGLCKSTSYCSYMEAAVLTRIDEQQTDVMVLTVAEVAKSLACSRSQVYELVKSGDIPSIRLGKSGVRVSKAELVKFINSGGCEAESSESQAAIYREATRKIGSSSAAWRR